MSVTPTVMEMGAGRANNGHAAQSSTCRAWGTGCSGAVALTSDVKLDMMICGMANQGDKGSFVCWMVGMV